MMSSQKLKKLIKNEGKRASKKAIKKLNKILEEKAKEIIKKAKRNADFAGRKTIKEEDIEKVIEEF